MKKYHRVTNDRINAFGLEVAGLHMSVYTLQEITKQSNERFDIYSKYYSFWYLTYQNAYFNLIVGLNRLCDATRGSISILQLFDKDNPHLMKWESKDQELFELLHKNIVLEKCKIWRDKLGFVHNDIKVFANLEKQKALFEGNKVQIDQIFSFLFVLLYSSLQI